MFRNVLGVLVILALPANVAFGQGNDVVIDVAKTATCGCCGGWTAQMQNEGFEMRPRDISYEELWDLKVSRGISEDLAACHTASVVGYTVEGHVPSQDILRLLAERPDAIGIAAPGMPIGAPGMDAIGAPSMGFGDEKDAYDVLLMLKDGTTQIFASYPGS